MTIPPAAHCKTTPVPARVILIQADDLGYDDLGSSGNPWVDTPNLDRLAAESVVAMDFTVNPVCAPSRATLLTGRHFLRTGVSHVHGGKDHLNLAETTLADVYSENGWNTAMWGKWHSGKTEGYNPWERGFGTALSLLLYRHENPSGKLNGQDVSSEGWADEWIFGQAIQYLEAHPDEPSFLYLPTMTPHGPLRAPDSLVARYRAKGLSEGLSTLYAMITLLDQEVGRLLDYLDEHDMRDDTLILFTSDNGPAINDHELSDADRRIRKIGARRGWKGDIWENGVRAPLFVRWPDGLDPHVIGVPLDQIDLFPTLLAWCGIEEPQTRFPLDGRDVRSLFRRHETEEMEIADPSVEAPIFNYAHPGWITGARAYDPRGIRREYNPLSSKDKAELQVEDQTISVRKGRYKLIRNPDQPDFDGNAPQRWVLIDLFDDPGEANDLSGQLPEVLADLQHELEMWFESVKDEPASFTAPVTPIRAGDLRLNATYAAHMSDSLDNSVPAVYNWSTAGEHAAYDVVFEESLALSVALQWREPAPSGMVFRLRVDGASEAVEATTDGSSKTSFPALRVDPGVGRLILEVREDVSEKPAEPPQLQALEIQAEG